MKGGKANPAQSGNLIFLNKYLNQIVVLENSNNTHSFIDIK